MEILSFSLKLFSGHLYGKSFFKTVRGHFPCSKDRYDTFQKANNKDDDQFAQMLVCTFGVCKLQSQDFSCQEPYIQVEALSTPYNISNS